MQIYYRSLQQRETDTADDVRLPVALGHRLVLVLGRVRRCRTRGSAGCGRGAGGAATSTTGSSAWRTASASPPGSTGARGKPARERVIQDVEVPVERPPEFLRWFDETSGCGRCGCARCAARARPGRRTRCAPGETYVNVGFWGTVADRARAPPTATSTARSRPRCTELGGHKSLYSDAYYDRETFDRLYGVANQTQGQAGDRPGRPADRPLREGGESSMTSTLNRPDTQITIGEAIDAADAGRRAVPLHGVRRQRGRARRTRRSTLAPGQRARAVLPAHRARRPRHGPRLRLRRPARSTASTRATRTRRCCCCSDESRLQDARRRPRRSRSSAGSGWSHLKPPPPAAAGGAAASGAGCSRASGTPRAATPRRSTTTTTCRTASTRWCSARR